MDFDVIWYEQYAVGSLLKAMLLQYLQPVTSAWLFGVLR
jgi:hypothetical protein